MFMETGDAENRPMVSRTFQRTVSGELIWDFSFDWQRVGNEGTYTVLMQLGDSALMSADSRDAGVGVNLVWGPLNDQERLGYRVGGSTTDMTGLSGAATVRVIVDLDQATYRVLVDGTMIGSVIPLDNAAALDTVRFFTDRVNENQFSGRTIDNVRISKARL
jgi:hypothetical protein